MHCIHTPCNDDRRNQRCRGSINGKLWTPFFGLGWKNQDTHKRHEGINVSTGITITNHTTAGRVVVHFPRVHVFGLWRSLSNSCPPLLGILCREYLHFCHRSRKFPVVRCRAGGIHFLFMITKRARTHRPHARTREYKWIWWRILKARSGCNG